MTMNIQAEKALPMYFRNFEHADDPMHFLLLISQVVTPNSHHTHVTPASGGGVMLVC